MNDRRISEIWFYPIKSLAGIRVRSARVMSKGLAYDRRWMLVDEEGRFFTQREHPHMALFQLELEGAQLKIAHPKNQDAIQLELTAAPTGPFSRVQIWDDEVEAVEVNPEFSHWFSERLGINCRLVFFPEENRRDIDPDYAKHREQVSLADGYPFLVIGQASLDLLNSKLSVPLPIRRFRPNFVVTGSTPHEEDTWRNIKIGKIAFEGVKPCARCVLTTVNPDTGEKGIEPLKTLSTYRKENGEVYFGENLIALENGVVNEGDQLQVIDLKK